jgi:hypothetical protein
MAEYSGPDAEYAARIVQRLLGRETEGLELEPDLAISDIESDASTFLEELEFLEQANLPVPAVRIAEEKVPVSLSFALGGSSEWALAPPFRFLGRRRRGDPFYYEYFYDLLRRLRDERPVSGFTSLGRDEARATFLRRATDFLATRVSAVRSFRNQHGGPPWYQLSMLTFRQLLHGQQVPTPGCQFSVSSNSNGLRVFWSGAYYVTPNYFSHPTSPAAGVLQSGTYIFGVDGGAYGNTVQWDLNSVVSLPGLPYVHLNY